MPTKPVDPHSLGGRLRARRRELGISQETIAKLCEVNQTTVSNWEHGGAVPSNAAVLIAKRLDVSLVWLLTGEGEGPAEAA